MTKKRTTKIIAILLALVLVLPTMPQGIVAYASEFHVMQLHVTAGKDQIRDANVTVSLKEEEISLTDVGNVYQQSIVSENNISGTYPVSITAKGFEPIQTNCAFETNGEVLEGTIDISDYKLYTISGNVLAYGDEAEKLAEVLVTSYAKGSEKGSTKTDQNGLYKLQGTKEIDTLIFEKEGYEKHTETVAIDGKDLSMGNITLKRLIGLTIHIENPDQGTVTVIPNEDSSKQQEITKDKSTLYFSEGTTLQILAKPKEDAALSSILEKQWTPGEEPENGLDLGNVYYEKITLKEDKTINLTFEPLNYVKVKYTNENIYYLRNKSKELVEKTAANQLKTMTNPFTQYYISSIEGLDVVEGMEDTYAFPEGNNLEGKLFFEKDEIDPKITVSGNGVLPEEVKGNWYINKEKVCYMDIADLESGVGTVEFQLNHEVYDIPLDRMSKSMYQASFSLTYRRLNRTTAGTPVTINASDRVGNKTTKGFYIYWDVIAPTVTGLKLHETCNQKVNGEKIPCIAGEKAEITVGLSDNYGVATLYYHFSEVSMNDMELKAAYENNEFTETDVNTLNSDEFTKDITIKTKDIGTGNWYLYAVASDFAGNICFDKDDMTGIACQRFFKDDQPPEIQTITDQSDIQTTFKRGTDSISLNSVFYDEHTPSGLSYYVTEPRLYTGNDMQAPNVSATEGTWTKIGDDEEEIKQYIHTYSAKNQGTSGSYIVWVYAKDGCQNLSKPVSFVYHVDNEAPVVSDFSFDIYENEKPVEQNRFSYRFGNFFRKNTVENNTQTVQIKVNAKDIPTGTYKEATPEVKEIYLYYVTKDQENEQQIYQDTISSNRILPAFSAKEAPKTKEGDTYTFSFEVPQKSMFYRLMIVAIDKAGNSTSYVPTKDGYQSDLVMVDQTKPEVSLSLQKTYQTPDYQVKVGKETKNWYQGSKNVTYDIKASDKESGIYATTMTSNGKTTFEESYTDVTTTKLTPEKTYQQAVGKETLLEDGSMTLEVTVKDNAGNITNQKDKIYIDKDKPIITGVTFAGGQKDDLAAVPMQYGFFFRKKTKVTIHATDFIGTTKEEGSGVKDFTYYFQDSTGKKTKEKVLTANKGKDQIYTASFEIPEGFKGQIYIKAKDNTNQETTYYNPKGTVIENQQEHQSHAKTQILLEETSYEDEEGNPLYNHIPSVQFLLEDKKSGIKTSEWSVKPYHLGIESEGKLEIKAEYDEEKDTFKSVLLGDTNWNVNKKLDLNLTTKAQKDVTLKNELNHIEIALAMMDQVGNTSKSESPIISIDTTDPVVEIEYDNNDVRNEKYYKEKRVATIKITDCNFSQEDTKIITTGDAIKIGQWEHHSGGACDGKVHTKECYHECQVIFDEDGEYTLTVETTDLAGNQGSYGKIDEFVVDLTAPVIHITYDNNSFLNGKYYKEARTGNLVITETNFDTEETKVMIEAKLDGTPIQAPTVSSYVKKGEKKETTNEATIDFTEDGDYKLDIEVTDLAGNKADIFVTQEFTIDQTPPELIVEGVEPGSANTGDVQPIITFTDRNQSKEDYDIYLTGANNGNVEFGKTITKLEDGATIDLGNFLYKEEVDDLYTLEVQVQDLAGNEVIDVREFSINRFGSVYVMAKETNQLLETYYNKEEQDLIVREINVDMLENEEVVVGIDSELTNLTKGDDYTLKHIKDENSWNIYEYCIKAKNFTKEGLYTVSIYSEDHASNKSSNKAKGKNLEFIIDKTAPSIVLGGIKEGGQYVQMEKEVTVDVQDNVLIDRIQIYVDGIPMDSKEQMELIDANGIVKTTLKSAGKRQVFQVVAKDAAGNQSKTENIHFIISTNLFLQWYSNKVLVVLTIVLGVLGLFGIVKYQKKKDALKDGMKEGEKVA